MERIITPDFADWIGRGKALVPAPILELIGVVEWFEGDMYPAGVWAPRWSQTHKTLDKDRSNILASYYGPSTSLWHKPASQRCQTIECPNPCGWGSRGGRRHHVRRIPAAGVVHELGHALQTALVGTTQGIHYPEIPLLGPGLTRALTSYKGTLFHERFAEAFTAYCLDDWRLHTTKRKDGQPEYLEGAHRLATDEAWRPLLAFFNGLAGDVAEAPPRGLRF